MNNEQLVRDAINQSISHNEIVRVTIERGDHDDAYMAVHEAVTSAVTTEWDSSNENDGSYDCFDLSGDESKWRIRVTVARRQYKFATDSETGTIEALTFDEAKSELDRKVNYHITGAWGWVEDVDGTRYEVGELP